MTTEAKTPTESKKLDADSLKELGRPFTLAAVKFKPLTKKGRDGKCVAAYYVDARLVAERLNHVVGPENWQDEYMKLLQTGPEMATHYFPIQCRLTVFGIEKSDVGVYQRDQADDKAWKSAFSDAFKRVAVKFRVGAYLYAIPRLRAEPNVYVVNGVEKIDGFSDSGKNYLERAYLKWLDNPDHNHFGDPLDHGDVMAVLGEGEDEEAIEFPVAAGGAP